MAFTCYYCENFILKNLNFGYKINSIDSQKADDFTAYYSKMELLLLLSRKTLWNLMWMGILDILLIDLQALVWREGN